MMALDLENSYKSIEEKIKASRTYLEVKSDGAKLRKEVKDNLQKDIQSVTTSIENLKEQKRRFQRQVKSQLEQMLSLAQFNSGSGPGTMRYLKTKLIELTLRIGPRIFDMLMKESISALGCSQQQAYDGNQVFYIKVKSVDLRRLLKNDPNEPNASVAYEKTPPTQGSIPYSMNRELWERLQNLNQPLDYFGASGQKLFEITYVQNSQPGNISGDFYRIKLYNRVNGPNKVADFLIDYYKSIKIIDNTNIFQNLIDQICGAISIDARIGTGELNETNKFLLILQRIFGLCFDDKKEIDVSGTAKIAELDLVDDSFFELTDIDLRNIDQTITNIKKGVVEFEDCDNVLLPVDSGALLEELIKMNEVNTLEEEQEIAENLVSTLVSNPRWRPLVPNSLDIELKADFSFLLNLPRAVTIALLSPKVILPLLIMSKAIGQTVADAIEIFNDFLRAFRKYVINVTSQIGALFVKELFELIKRDINRLVNEIISDISREVMQKKYAIILKLVAIVLTIIRGVRDYRQCKSVVDEILALLDLALSFIPNRIPSFLLAGSQFLNGFSNSRAFINVIEEFQRVGLPTGPLPDGSPNLFLQSILSQVKGVEKENQNRKTQIFVKPLTITPAGLTLPSGDIFGMSY